MFLKSFAIIGVCLFFTQVACETYAWTYGYTPQKYEFHGIVPCTVKVPSATKLEVTKSQRTSGYNVHFEFDRDVSVWSEYHADAYKWDPEHQQWSEDVFTTAGGYLQHALERYLPDAWPKIEDASCPYGIVKSGNESVVTSIPAVRLTYRGFHKKNNTRSVELRCLFVNV